MIVQVYVCTMGIRALGKIDKVYLDNTNLVYALAKNNQNIGNVRETFFINQLRVHHEVLSSTIADFRIEDMDFEIGGKNKGNKQLVDAKKGFVVKDDIERGFLNTVPLWYFGLLY